MATENVELAKVQIFIRERPWKESSSSSPKTEQPTQSKPYIYLSPTSKAQQSKKKEKPKSITEISDDSTTLKLLNPKSFQSPRSSQMEFDFDRIYSSNTTQKQMFTDIGSPIVNHALNGFNACCFAYGQTGSGKTYSIFGTNEDCGLLPRSLDHLFEHLQPHNSEKGYFQLPNNQSDDNDHKYCVVVSFLEIYLDRMRDLGLSYLINKGIITEPEITPIIIPMNSPKNTFKSHPFDGMNKLEIREDANGQIFVQDLHQIPIKSAQDALEVMRIGLKYRQTQSTVMNCCSSRSHTIFTVSILQNAFDNNDEMEVYGRMHFIDLAGSEKLNQCQNRIRMQEAVDINKSLSALGKCIISLSNPSKFSHVPFRDSKLTRLLQSSLNGNCYTSLIATINPNECNYEETLSTLTFAHRCTNVYTRVHSNYLTHKDKMFKLQQRIHRLLKELSIMKGQNMFSPNAQNHDFDDSEINDLRKFVYPNAPTDIHRNSLSNHVPLRSTVPRTTSSFTASANINYPQHIHHQNNYPQHHNFDHQHNISQSHSISHGDDAAFREQMKRESKAKDDKIKKLQKQIVDLQNNVESKEQTIKNMNALHKESSQKQRINLIECNKNIIKTMLYKLLRTPTYSLRANINRLINEHNLDKMEINQSKQQQKICSINNMNWNKLHISRKEFEKQCRKMEVDKKESIKQIKAKYSEMVKHKKQRINDLKNEIKTMQNEQALQHQKLEKEFSFLYKCLANLTTIVEAVENGKFSVHISSGIKKIKVAKGDDSISSEHTLLRCQTLKELLHRSTSLIQKQEEYDGASDDGSMPDLDANDTRVVIDNDNQSDFEYDSDKSCNGELFVEEEDEEKSVEPAKYYQAQALQTRNALNSLRIAFESQKRQLSAQDKRLKSVMMTRSNSMSIASTQRMRSRSLRPCSAKIIMKEKPQKHTKSVSFRKTKRLRPSSARLPFNHLPTNRIRAKRG